MHSLFPSRFYVGPRWLVSWTYLCYGCWWPGCFKRLCQYQRRKSGGCHVRSNTGQSVGPDREWLCACSQNLAVLFPPRCIFKATSYSDKVKFPFNTQIMTNVIGITGTCETNYISHLLWTAPFHANGQLYSFSWACNSHYHIFCSLNDFSCMHEYIYTIHINHTHFHTLIFKLAYDQLSRQGLGNSEQPNVIRHTHSCSRLAAAFVPCGSSLFCVKSSIQITA